MEKLAAINKDLVELFPPGIKIISSQLPLSDYTVLISLSFTIIGLILLISVIR